MLSRVLATVLSVPLDSDPLSLGGRDSTEEADGAPVVLEFNTLSEFQLGRVLLDDHLFNVLWLLLE